MVVGGAPTKYETHVKDVCMGTCSGLFLNFLKTTDQTLIFMF